MHPPSTSFHGLPPTLQFTTGISPSELLLGHRPQSRLDLLKPNTAERVEQSQMNQKQHHDRRSRERNFEVGDDVFVRNYHHGDKWLPGIVQKKTGPVYSQIATIDVVIRIKFAVVQ